MPEKWERQKRAITELIKIINLKYPCWGIKVNDWKLTYTRGLLTITLSAEVKQTLFEAPFSIIVPRREIVFESAGKG
jgi:hypothetical protein